MQDIVVVIWKGVHERKNIEISKKIKEVCMKAGVTQEKDEEKWMCGDWLYQVGKTKKNMLAL